MLNFKILMGNHCFAMKLSSKWVKIERMRASERACQAKASLANRNRARLSEANQVKPSILWQSIAKQASKVKRATRNKAKQARKQTNKQAKQSEQAS